MIEREVKVLDINVSNQIAAGEVVEKPASVVKELVENALDAGATSIDVNMVAGGTEYLRVQDNGCGMSEANARLAVQRHATSKLRSAQDLLTIGTLGFRGEALPSIASVSEFELLTRPESQEFATSLKICGGAELSCEHAGGPLGTTVIVKNLFFNVPARRKFLHTVSTEGRYISELLTRLALTRPDVRFRLTSGDREVLATPGVGGLKATIQELYGKKVAKELLPVQYDDLGVQVTGYVGNPTLYKGNRSWQTLIVNGRVINSQMLGKALQHAYQSMIPKSGFPFAVLHITVDPHQIDVNVHPQKSEVRFSDESTVYKAVYRALTDALTQPMAATPVPPAAQQLRDAERLLAQEAALQQVLPGVRLQAGTNGAIGAGSAKLAASGNAVTSGNAGSTDVATAVRPKPALGADGTPIREVAEGGFLRPQFRAEQGSIWKTPEKKDSPAQNAAHTDLDALAAAAIKPFAEAASPVEALTAQGTKQTTLGMEFHPIRESIFKVAEDPTVGVAATRAVEPSVTSAEAGAQVVKESATEAGELPPAQVAQRGVNALDGYSQEPRDNAVCLQASGSTGLAALWPIGQVDKTFIIAQSETSLYLVDQHAAAERVLYDKLVAQHHEIPSQQLLIPLYLDARAQDVELIERYHDEFVKLGVDIAPGGEQTLRVSSLPVDVGEADAADFVADITAYLRRSGDAPDPSELRQEVLHMAACRGAIKAGEVLSPRQMKQLITDLCNSTHPYTCPHGRPCMLELTSKDLAKMFKRTGFNLEKPKEWES